jgi:hypothetical protein
VQGPTATSAAATVMMKKHHDLSVEGVAKTAETDQSQGWRSSASTRATNNIQQVAADDDPRTPDKKQGADDQVMFEPTGESVHHFSFHSCYSKIAPTIATNKRSETLTKGSSTE